MERWTNYSRRCERARSFVFSIFEPLIPFQTIVTLELELTPEQESWLRQTAARTGLDQHRALLAVIDRHRAAEDPLAGLPDDEAALRSEIQRRLPEAILARYRDLSERNQREEISTAEHRELTELIDIVEADHAARVARVAKLARICGEDFSQLMREQGLLREVH